ncbi:hypothetical protein BC835DRAFT_1276955, partial [Cytidiella melzeri]
AYTPPNPVPDTTETAKYGAKSDTLSRHQFTRRLGFATKAGFWIYAACESAVILANTFPSETSSSVFLWLVRPGSSPSAVRVTPTWLVGCACMCIGPIIRSVAIRELGKFFTWELSIKKGQHLITTGPYSFVRHPAYLGNVFMLAGTFVAHIGPGSWYREGGWLNTVGGKVVAALWLANALFVPVMLLLCVQKEDETLREHYPEEWDAWAKNTPYKVIPYLY